MSISDDLGLKSPVIQKPFETKRATSIVARVILAAAGETPTPPELKGHVDKSSHATSC